MLKQHRFFVEVIIMANKEKVLEGLQIIVTDLAQQADSHAIQSRVFASEGFARLAEVMERSLPEPLKVYLYP